MTTTAESLNGIITAKESIRSSIQNKGVVCDTSLKLSEYPAKINSIASALWVRPEGWLTLPTVTTGQQKVVLLIAVYDDDSNYATVCAGGNYTVDWGDGTIANYVDWSYQEHRYTYSSLSSPICVGGYKTAIITITPQAGSVMSALELSGKTTALNSGRGQTPPWLEIVICLSNLNFFYLSSSQNTAAYLKSFTLLDNAFTNFSQFFDYCPSLENVVLSNTSAGTNMWRMFNNCSVLKTVTLFETSNVTNMSEMFSGCTNLIIVPLFDTSNVTNMSRMFSNCVALNSIPPFNTTNVTDMSYMFSGCYNINNIPSFNTSNVVNFGSMFAGCGSLNNTPTFITSIANNMLNMFNNCVGLRHVPALDANSVVSGNFNMFSNCRALTKCSMINIKYSISFLNCELSANNLNEIFNNLPTTSGQTITITGNWGAATSNNSIASTKGWTVVN